jgi:Mitochondrial carrier protein
MPLYEYIKRGGPSGGDNLPTPTRIAIASACSAALVSIIAFPSEVVRVRLQAQEMRGHEAGVQHQKYQGVHDACRTILRVEGISGLYRGLSASLLRTVPNSAIGLLTFETLLRTTSSLFASLDAGFNESALSNEP